MMIDRSHTDHWPAQRLYQHFAARSGTQLRAIIESISTREQDGSDTEDTESAPESPLRSQPREARSRRRRRSQSTVLVIDDEEPVRETLVEVLSFHGYRVITAASVREAEDAKQQLGVEGIHLVIVDIHLTPGGQLRAGYALAQRWRAERPGFPIILISGDRSNEDLPEVREGAMRFLLKPFGMEVLLQAVRETLRR